MLLRHGLTCPRRNVLAQRARPWWMAPPLRSGSREAVAGSLAVAAAVQQQLATTTQTLATYVTADPQAQLLQTIPGIGPYAALLILSEIGDIKRFPTARHLGSYAGLVPSVHASGGKTRLGRLTKQGSKWLRWILVELSVHAINGAPQFRSLYHRVAKKHGANTGRVAVARAMLKTIYAMLRKGQPFRPMDQGTTGQCRGVMAAA
ncbi:MAG: transposase [Candidatus Methylomirabilales bacterium]